MAEFKKKEESLPQDLLSELNRAIKLKTGNNTNKFVREAVAVYIRRRKITNMMELMKKGYVEMAYINSQLSECGIDCDCTELCKYEAVLAESDITDDSNRKKRRYILC